MSAIIECIVIATGGGKFNWAVREPRAEGCSRQPLFDSCRALKRMGVDTGTKIGLFHKGSTTASIVTTVGEGADLTVYEGPNGPKFRKFQEFNRGSLSDE